MRTKSLSVGSTIAETRSSFERAEIPDALQEARALVRSALRLSATELLVDRERKLTPNDLAKVDSFVLRRLKREPLQYITGEVEFYGRTFHVDARVLIPRPETELLVEQVLAYVTENGFSDPRILDIGTGSGVIAVSIAAELPDARVVATDVSADALAVATDNARAAGVDQRGEFHESVLADGVPGRFDIVVSNPPYVLSAFLDGPDVQPELQYEPREALDGGADGMTVYNGLILALDSLLKARSAAFIEIDPPVAGACLTAANQHLPGAAVSILTDLSGLERCLLVERSN